MTLTLPWIDSRLLPNRKLHWTVKRRATSEARETAWAIATDWKHGIDGRPCEKRIHTPLKGCTAVVTFHPPDRRRRDLDNLLRACKPFWDGIVDAGILEDDSCVQLISVRRGELDKANPRTEIEIEEV